MIDEDFGLTHENHKLDFDRYLIKDGKTFILDLDYHNDICIPDEAPGPMLVPDNTDYGWTAPVEIEDSCDEEDFDGTKDGPAVDHCQFTNLTKHILILLRARNGLRPVMQDNQSITTMNPKLIQNRGLKRHQKQSEL